MTTVTIQKNDKDEYVGFHCFGHAEYVKYTFLDTLTFQKNKPDILCASISVLVINTMNVLEELHKVEMKVETNEETGFISCRFLNSLSKEAIVLMDAMIYGLKKLSQEYGEQYLLVKTEEV